MIRSSKACVLWLLFRTDSQIDINDKVRKGAKIRNRYNQVPHLTQDTTWESNKNTV